MRALSARSIHRSDNTDDKDRLEQIIYSLADLDLPTVFLAHPRLVGKCKEHGTELSRRNLFEHRPFTYPELVGSALHSAGVEGLHKEALLLGTLCTTVGPETECIETVELGWNQLVEARNTQVKVAQRPQPKVTEKPPRKS